MTLPEELYKPFIEYLNKEKSGSWLEKGLITDAPPEAVKAFEKYKHFIEEAKKRGVDC